MAPRPSMTQSQKLERILAYLHESGTCHTLKDLETAIPTATKINKMQVKELVKELTDTDQVKVEKIGSGNWYWAWAGQEVSEKQQLLTRLELEEAMLTGTIHGLESQLETARNVQSMDTNTPEYNRLNTELGPLETEVKALIRKKEDWDSFIGGNIECKNLEAQRHRANAVVHTENIHALEAYIRRQLPVSMDDMDGLRRECYGKLYIEGGSIAELDEA